MKPYFFISLFIILALVACGRDDGSQGANGSAERSTNQSPNASNQPNLMNSISRAYALKSQMPACDASISGQLVYAMDEKTFYVCSDSWVAIDIKGAKGETGAQGTAGATGPQGQTVYQAVNQWFDPVTGQEWIFGGYSPVYGWTSLCQNGYNVPSIDQLYTASQRGFLIQKGLTDGWAIHAMGTIGYIKASDSSETYATAGSHGVVCIKQ